LNKLALVGAFSDLIYMGFFDGIGSTPTRTPTDLLRGVLLAFLW
jgi:hypothetical protein